MARIGPRHSQGDDTSGKSKEEKDRKRKDDATRNRNAKLNQTQRKATGKATNPPA